MIIIYGCILISYLWIGIKARRKFKERKSLFTVIAYELTDKIPIEKNNRKRREQIKQVHSILYDNDRVIKLDQEERIQTLELLLKIILVGTIMASGMYIKEVVSSHLTDGNQILRSGYFSGSDEISVVAELGEERYEFPILVSEQKYAEYEVYELYDQYEQVLYERMLGFNGTGDYVTEDLQFLTNIEGYPFTNEWTSNNYNVIQRNGEINSEIDNLEGQVVMIQVKSTYYEYEQLFQYQLCVYPKVQSEEESSTEKLQDIIRIINVEGQEDKYIILPDEYEDQIVLWSYQTESTNYILFILTIVASSCIYMQRKNSLLDALKKREEQMTFDYGMLINQLVLYLGAGMTMRKSFTKIANDYHESGKDPPRYIYEEIYNLFYELESGVSESEAYENLGKRCNNRLYLKFGTLLSQNVRKGSGELIYTLKSELIQAQEERKAYIRIKAEQATTKLLVPMIMMLGIVMIIIIVPAFLSFQI